MTEREDPYVQLAARLIGAFPGAHLSAITQRILLEKLRGFGLERSTKGVEHLISGRKEGLTFFPSISEICTAIRAIPGEDQFYKALPDLEDTEPVESGVFKGGVLKGQEWSSAELYTEDGVARPLENNGVSRRAAEEMQRRIERRFGMGAAEPAEAPDWA